MSVSTTQYETILGDDLELLEDSTDCILFSNKYQQWAVGLPYLSMRNIGLICIWKRNFRLFAYCLLFSFLSWLVDPLLYKEILELARIAAFFFVIFLSHWNIKNLTNYQVEKNGPPCLPRIVRVGIAFGILEVVNFCLKFEPLVYS